MTSIRSRPIQMDGRTILWSRFHFTDGKYRPEVTDAVMRAGWPTVGAGWTIVRHTPKVPLWVKSTHASASRAHRCRYQLVATHVSGEQCTLTAFLCSQDPAVSKVIVVDRPETYSRAICWTCARTEPVVPKRSA